MSETPQGMTPATVKRLLALNQEFYSAVGADFDATRQGIPAGMTHALEFMPQPGGQRLRVVDVGCGNGRLARALNQVGQPCDYVGVDNDELLLARASEQTAALERVETRFVRADLAEPGWDLGVEPGAFDVAFCLATLHHFPGEALRRRILAEIAALTACRNVILGVWQFQNSARLMARIQPWSAIGLCDDDVEAGDALLPWDQGVHALRYVHAIALEEIKRIAQFSGLTVRVHFFADGAEGNLNLYSVLGPRAPDVHSQGESIER